MFSYYLHIFHSSFSHWRKVFLVLPLTVIDANLPGCRWVIGTCGTADLELDISAETFSPPDEGALAITIASEIWLHVRFLRLCMIWHRCHRIAHDWTLLYTVVSSEGAWGRVACHDFAPHISSLPGHFSPQYHPIPVKDCSNNLSCLLQRILWWVYCGKNYKCGQWNICPKIRASNPLLIHMIQMIWSDLTWL